MLGVYFYLNRKKVDTTETETNIFQKFNPFGSSEKTTPTGNTETETPTTDIGEGIKEVSKFYQITKFSIAGATFLEDERPLPKKEKVVDEVIREEVLVDSKTTKTAVKKVVVPPEPTTEIVPSLRYVERATGHVYQMYLDTKVEGKVSNSTIPSVYETIFDGTASSIIYRYFSPENKTITSFLALLGGTNSLFLNPDILEISLSPDKNSFFFITKNKNGSVGYTRSFNNTKTNQVFTSSFSEWLPQWAKDRNVFLTTKPSYLVEGSVFSLDITNGTLSKLFGGVAGLTTLANKDGSVLLFGASLDTGPRLNIFNIKNHTSIDLKTYGLPEKCVWSSDNINVYCAVPNTIMGTQFPDSWYQGLVSFDDYFVKINTNTGDVYNLGNSSKETPIDGTHLFLDKKESTLFFTNKKDATLWSLSI